jgi:hypothetical protein
MVTRRSLLKAAAAGSVAMAAQAVSPLRSSAATQGGDILAWVSYDPAQLLPSFNAFMTWTSVVPGRVTFDAPASGAVLLGVVLAAVVFVFLFFAVLLVVIPVPFVSWSPGGTRDTLGNVGNEPMIKPGEAKQPGEPKAGEKWIDTGPHIMIMNIGDHFAGYPTTAANTKAPYVMFAGTPYAHLMIPVK